jgi:hypothetical protein
LIYAKPVRTCKCVFKRIVQTFTFIAALLAAPVLATPLAALAPALLATSLAVFTILTYFYSIIRCSFSLASYFCILTEEACALPCYACATYCCNLYLELFAFVTANKEKEEEEEKEEEKEEKEE